MRSTFFNLDSETRESLLDACAREFGEKGYELASTNTIVQVCGISKGSFFKYFGSKSSVYLYLVTRVLQELGEIQGSRATYTSSDIVARAEELFVRHMEYARRFPIRYRFILRALLETNSPIYAKVAAIRDEISERTSGYLYEGVDWSRYRYPKADVVEFLRCLDLGLRQAALQSLGKGTDIKAFEAYVAPRLALARRILSTGLYATSPQEDKA
jgi:TetR/AcrR family transcriptional regulator